MPSALPRDHDQASASLDEPSVRTVLSSVLDSVRLTGAMFFLVDVSAPWLSKAPDARAFAPVVLPHARHIISYHVIAKGRCWAGLTGGEPERLDAGDVLVVPHGDSYFLAHDEHADAATGPEVEVAFFQQMAEGKLPPIVGQSSAGGESTHFLCGFLGCDTLPTNSLLAALPKVLVLRKPTAGPDTMAHLVPLALSEIHAQRAGDRSVLLRLSELMFVEVLRRHVETAQLRDEASGRPGWLSGLRDPLVARMLAALHAAPSRPWTLDALASAAGCSRTIAAARFSTLVGQPPLKYLTAHRMQLASRLLRDPGNKIHVIAEAVGYGSEAAFSRAYKKAVGVSPARWRGSVPP